MRIVHVVWELVPGGSEFMLVDIVNEQCKSHTVHILILNQRESRTLIERLDSRISIHKINRKPKSKSIFKMLRANHYIMSLYPDIVHCHNFNQIAYLSLVKLMGIQMVLTVHSTGMPGKYLSKYDRLSAISKAVAEDIYARFGLHAVIIYNGIKTDSILTRPAGLEFRRIMQLGRLDHSSKGQDILLRAFAKLVNANKCDGITLDFIGSGQSEQYLKSMSKELNITKHCRYLGQKNRQWIYNNLCNYDLLVQPSRYEGFGLTVVEAMAAEVPVLVSDVDGPMEIIDNGEYGYFFRSEDIEDLANRVLSIMQNYDTIEFRNMINRARARARDMFDVRKTVESYLHLYFQVAGLEEEFSNDN